jgi:hypothetical protein
VDTTVRIEIEAMRGAGLASLREKYREVFQDEARSRNREHLFRRIAWGLQARAEGDLSDRARARAQAIAQDADLRLVAPRNFLEVDGRKVHVAQEDRKRSGEGRRLPSPGYLLSRKWDGRTLLVEVLAKGFRYEGRHYASLSAIATEATGTRWNGWAFFGLVRPESHRGKGARRAKK